MISQRFADNNPSIHAGPLATIAPQQVKAIPRASNVESNAISLNGEDLTGRFWGGVPPLYTMAVGGDPAFDSLFFTLSGVTFEGRLVDGSVNATQDGDWYVSGTTLVVRAGGSPTSYFDAVWFDHDNVHWSDHASKRNLSLLRTVYHPGRDLAYQYPANPDRTLNYYHNPIRRHDVNVMRTLSANVNFLDKQTWDDVVVSEIWGVGKNTLAMLSDFFETLHLMAIEDPPLGSYMGWSPFDLSYSRHLIQPIDLKVGPADADIHEVRERYETGLDSYIDRQVTFTFKLVRGTSFADSLLIAEGY